MGNDVTRLAEFAELVLLVTVYASPAVLFATGCHELARWYWSREAIRDEERRNLYREAEAIAAARVGGPISHPVQRVHAWDSAICATCGGFGDCSEGRCDE